jgi:hypothetical protein
MLRICSLQNAVSLMGQHKCFLKVRALGGLRTFPGSGMGIQFLIRWQEHRCQHCQTRLYTIGKFYRHCSSEPLSIVFLSSVLTFITHVPNHQHHHHHHLLPIKKCTYSYHLSSYCSFDHAPTASQHYHSQQ